MGSELERFLERLRDSNSGALTTKGLQRLSGLFREELRQFRQVWPTISLDRRRRIVRLLAELAEDNVELDYVEVFKVCLDDPDEEIRAEAIGGLWEDESQETAIVLVKKLESDPSPRVRAAAASALGSFTYLAETEKLGPRMAKTVKDALLAAIYNEAESVEVRRRAIEAIAYVSEEPVTALIQWAYHHPDGKMRASAVFAMGRNCDLKWLPILKDEMTSSSSEMRYEAARASGELESKEAAPQLVALTRDPDPEVRMAAVISLGQIGGKLAKGTLQKLIENGDDALREAAEESLEEAISREDPMGFRNIL